MLSQSSYKQETEERSNETSFEASKSILINEHYSLLKSIEPVRSVNRILVIACISLQVFQLPLPQFRQIAVLTVSIMVCIYWYLQQLRVNTGIDRLGRLIASKSAEIISGSQPTITQKVVLPQKKAQDLSPLDKRVSEAEGVHLGSPTIGPLWTNVYILWRHIVGKERGIRDLQQSEPLIWIVVMALLEIIHKIQF